MKRPPQVPHSPTGRVHSTADVLNHLAEWLESRPLTPATADDVQTMFETAVESLGGDELDNVSEAARRWVLEARWNASCSAARSLRVS